MNGHVSVDEESRPELLITLAPSRDFIHSVVTSATLADGQIRLILASCIARAAETGDEATLELLLAQDLASPDATTTDGVPAIIAATFLRHGECVRLLVEAKADVNARDTQGWTALFWAVAVGDCALAAFLLNRGARLDLQSLKGLRPEQLLTTGPDADSMREILDFAAERASPELRRDAKGKQRAVDKEQLAFIRKKLEAAKEAARHLDLDLDALGLDEEGEPSRASTSDEPFDWHTCAYDQMLVFASSDIPALVTVIVDEAKIEPGNAAADLLFLCARYAALIGPDGVLDRLFAATLSRIEDVFKAVPDNLALMSYWLSNMLTLLHYLRKDTQLSPITSVIQHTDDDDEEVQSIQDELSLFINELFVHVLRIPERRINAILDAAMLDYESLPLEEVRFEGEWRMPKAFNSLHRRKESTNSPSAFSLFRDQGSPQLANGVLKKGQSLTNLREPPSPSVHSPRTVAAILSSVVFVLQQYRLPPFLVLQLLEQVLYWLSCELFNGILTRKRHLCRSRAMQIRLNASSLEDWARVNRFPTRLLSRPFEPLNALLQWLQCLSSEASLSDLLHTLQQIRPLNPPQLLRTALDYRYEVDEPHLADECMQYLEQMALDWEQRTRQRTNSNSSGEERDRKNELVMLHLDDLFREGGSGATLYDPPSAPDCLGELTDSRHMLPFALPSITDLLMPHQGGHLFGPLSSTAAIERQETVPMPPDGILEALDRASARMRAARAVRAHNRAQWDTSA